MLFLCRYVVYSIIVVYFAKSWNISAKICRTYRMPIGHYSRASNLSVIGLTVDVISFRFVIGFRPVITYIGRIWQRIISLDDAKRRHFLVCRSKVGVDGINGSKFVGIQFYKRGLDKVHYISVFRQGQKNLPLVCNDFSYNIILFRIIPLDVKNRTAMMTLASIRGHQQ